MFFVVFGTEAFNEKGGFQNEFSKSRLDSVYFWINSFGNRLIFNGRKLRMIFLSDPYYSALGNATIPLAGGSDK